MSSGNPETRERILKEACRLMEEQHGQDVRMADIARAAGISRQAVYLHFPSRTELMVAAVRYIDEVHGLEQRLARSRAAQTGPESLDALVEFWGNYIPIIYNAAKGLRNTKETDEAAAAAWDDRMSALREGCSQVVECLVRDRKLANDWSPGRATEFLWSLLSIEVWENLTVDCGWSNDDYITWLQLALKRILLPASGTGNIARSG